MGATYPSRHRISHPDVTTGVDLKIVKSNKRLLIEVVDERLSLERVWVNSVDGCTSSSASIGGDMQRSIEVDAAMCVHDGRRRRDVVQLMRRSIEKVLIAVIEAPAGEEKCISLCDEARRLVVVRRIRRPNLFDLCFGAYEIKECWIESHKVGSIKVFVAVCS